MEKSNAEINLLFAEFLGFGLETSCMYNDSEDDEPKPFFRYNSLAGGSRQHHACRIWDESTIYMEVPETMKFCTSWDWFMLVAKKLFQITASEQLNDKAYCMLMAAYVKEFILSVDLDLAVWRASMFVEHYNKIKQ